MKWNETVTLQFVKIYLKNECLWNPSHPNYKLKWERDKSYSNIISEFKASTSKSLSIPEVKVKIKNLRTTYVQQVHKILQQSNPDSIYEPSLIWFNEMDKCLKNIPNRRHSTPVVHSQDTSGSVVEVDSSTQLWTPQEILHVEEPMPDPLVPLTDASDNSQANVEDFDIDKKQNDILHCRKKSKRKKIKRVISKVMPDCSTDSIQLPVNAQEDEFDIYGKFIATQLRQMELQKALRLQLAIQNLISEARISDGC